MYTVQDAEAACRLFRGVEYGKRIELAPGIEARFVDVGHLLGSASIELWITEGSTTTKLVFSGDIGNLEQPIIKDPTYIQQADYVFMESTYGDRNHAPRPDYVAELAKILQRTFDRGGNVVVPSFAVGRTQEMLYFLREIKEKGLVKGHGNFPVYIDSPLATEATRIFRDTDPDCFDAQTRALLEKGIDPINVPGLRISVTSDDSRMIQHRPHAQGHPVCQRECAKPDASATTSSTTCGGRNAPFCSWAFRRWALWGAPSSKGWTRSSCSVSPSR